MESIGLQTQEIVAEHCGLMGSPNNAICIDHRDGQAKKMVLRTHKWYSPW